MEITIETGIREAHIATASELYAQAFESKFLKLLGDREVMKGLLSKGINSDRAIAALDEHHQLVGIVGFHLHKKALAEISLRSLINQFGLIRGLMKFLLMGLIFYRKTNDKDQLLMDGIAVKEGCRGHGIGKKLLSALEAFAMEEGLSSIKLDVIDENPKAKRLYEKIGFIKTRYQQVPRFISKLIGVTGVTTMVKPMR